MKRAALLTGALALVLAGCGGTSDDATGKAGTPGPGTPSAGTTPSAAAARECPVKAVSGPAPAGVSADLATKPTVPANSAPAPTDITVADLVVGTGPEATTLAKVEAKYVGALYTDGTEFDSSWKTSPDTTIPFNVCATGTIPGFSVAPTCLKVGGRRVVTIPDMYGYGAEGSPPKIPGNATLVFVIDLVKVTPPAG